ncbi:hypothetical protein ESZ91_04110 [Candidatus Borkfalkia ceftriaxoniphila]|uniref:Anti-sigma factor RsgI-like middle domain-containing protein n=1 Tax=Candidatus Borkfalkia ceftriaxoniphila TaxID=2508949 RepID=A0A4V1QV66_9FIRM|nr:hypothetical protein [Candidatus Borkfalkia ceftriaxoniphila]RXZ61586.1 hypothetical protein ESZ91_04110 [Candidatus Borkfalkia ceftriaxoniphila]
MKFWKKIAACGLSVALAVGTGVLLTGCGGSEKDAAARMQVDINPSVEFILDADNKVLSVTALNDDGSLIIAGEAFVGKTAEEAVEMMVSISTDAGYLVKGELTAERDAITISITGDDAAAQELYEEVKAEIDGFLEESGIYAVVERGEELKLEALRELVMKADPSVTEEEVAKMNEEQLINALKISRIETAQLITEELREAYNVAKEYDLRFAERQATKDVIDGLGSAYESFLNLYSKALDSYQETIAAVEQARYDNFVDVGSQYQKALAEVREQKDRVLAQRKEVAQLSEGPAKEAAEAALDAEEAALMFKEDALNIAGSAANAAFDLVLGAMKTAENVLIELEKTFPEEIKTALTESAQKTQDAMNEAKDKAFAKFEEAHKEDIENALAELEARKQELIEANKPAA